MSREGRASATFHTAMRVHRFGPTIFEGQTVPANYMVSAAAIAPKFTMHPYFGISLSADILQLGLDFLNMTKQIGHPSADTGK
jgi:hypothetical protein